jgi:signal transduction histidine kinase
MEFLDDLRDYLERPDQMEERYALEIRAVRRSGGKRILTPIGRLILELPDRDALRWMLAVEAVQAHGVEDEWRLSRTSATKLLKFPEGDYDSTDEARMAELIPWNILTRLTKMGIAEIIYDAGNEIARYKVIAEGRLLLEEIASGQSTPLVVLAQALLEDETAAIIGQFRPVAELVQREGAAAATTRHARMVAHEIRNALVPVQVAIGAFYRDLERRGEGTFIEEHRGAIDGGIDRIFTFVKEMVNVAARGAEPTEPFDVTPAIEGAIAAVASDLGLKVSFAPPGNLPPIVGHRSRFTLAIINLLRNAAQTRTERDVEVRIAADMSADGDAVVISVDDDGPGVPPEFREAIFRRGVSLRPGGEGAGEGLALVREVVETEMGGRATCEQSPSGGARLVLRISVNGRRTGA